jgi:CBS domain containing-hemolysin-like protein
VDGLFLSGFMLFAALFFVGLNGLFVLAEFSFATLRGTQVERLVNEGKASAGLVREATRRLDAYLAVCQLGITISSLSLGALGEPAIASLIVEPLLEPFALPEGVIHTIAFTIGFLIITTLHVVLGELVPKSIGIQRPEGSSLFIAPFMRAFYYLFLPLMVVFNGTGNAIVRAFGIPPASEKGETHTEEEVRMIIAQAGRHGILEKSDEEMLKGIFELGETVVREAMTPRPDVVTLPADMSLSELAKVVSAGSHTRYPLREDADPDRIVGVVHAKDVLRAAEAAQSFQADVVARELMREFVTAPENRLLEDVLAEFRRRNVHMAVVIDEWGSFEGIITIEDVLEEIVGEIEDEFDEEEPVVRRLPDGTYAVEGRARLREVTEAMGSDFEAGGFDTVGGLVLGLLGRPPKVGDEVWVGGRALRVESVDALRVERVTVREDAREVPEPRNGDRRKIFVRLDDSGLDEHRAVLSRVEDILDGSPDSEVELVVVGGAAPRANLLGFLTKGGLGVAVCGSTLRVWRPRGAPALRGSRATRGVGYARGRRKGSR